MIRDIVIWPDKRLHEVSTTVPEADLDSPEMKALVQDMFDTMYDAKGVGLAAIQIGVPARVFVMDVKEPVAFINPITVSTAGIPEEKNEGCLSLPGIIEMVPRYPMTRVAWWNPTTKTVEERLFHNMEAQCCQHEIEHLDGVIIPDKLTPLARSRLASRMKKARK